MSHRLRRMLAPLVAVVMLTLAASTLGTVARQPAAWADNASMEAQFVAAMNSARQAAGLHPYSVAGDIVAVARRHSNEMAARQSLYHNPSFTSEIGNWQAVGENVGRGPSVQDIHDAFMASPEHRANILDHDFTQVGVGVTVDKDGTIWVTENFRQPMSSSPAQRPTTSTPVTHASTGSGGPVAASTSTALPAPPSPRAVLLHKLRDLRHRHAPAPTADPVAQAFDYVAALSRLAG